MRPVPTVSDLPAGAASPAPPDSLHAVSRLLAAAVDAGGPATVGSQLVREACELFDVDTALLMFVGQRESRGEVVAACPSDATTRPLLPLAEMPGVREALTQRAPFLRLAPADAYTLGDSLLLRGGVRAALLVPVRVRERLEHVLALFDHRERSFSEEEVEVAGALAAASAASFAQLQLAEEHAAQMAKQSTLIRAAKSLNESLDLAHVLVRICHEAGSILDCDNTMVCRGDGESGLTVEAASGFPPEAIGFRLPPGEGLSGQVAVSGQPMIVDDYQTLENLPKGPFFADTRGCVAVPMRWDGALRGVLSVGWSRPFPVTQDHVKLLAAFAELAAAACRNASAHAGMELAARSDSLTGCLNHAALHDALTREIERCGRTGHRLSLAIVDLDDFKQVNEEHGHLVGDEVLRRVGHALGQGVRSYDLVARYGGDEFAIVCAEADEAEGADVAGRSLAAVSRSLSELQHGPGPGHATAGVAEWEPGQSATKLIAAADRALLYGKQQGVRGAINLASEMPGDFRPGRFEVHDRPALREATPKATWPRDREQTERLRKRTRQLALANSLGSRLAAMTEPAAIMEAAMDELQRAFGYYMCGVIRVREDGYVESTTGRGEAFARLAELGWSQPRSAGVIGRCLRERRAVVTGDVTSDADYRATSETGDVRSELCVPLWVGDELFGAINVEELRFEAFDDDDVRSVRTVADQLGSALRSATLYDHLERAYMGTAEALATALEAKDSYDGHSRSVVRDAEEVGRQIGMDQDALRTLRLGAIFHDIGKIAVPAEILDKRGALDDEEWRIVRRHTVMGERILSSVDFLSDALPVVRHEHERWDGGGYPDRLQAEDIPLGSRIVLVCDAYDAMTSDRPYRGAMSESDARAELTRCAGTQFDARVVGAFVEVLDRRAAAERSLAAVSYPSARGPPRPPC